MENVKILVDGIEKNVYGLFYIYDSKYYFIYTEKEVDENNYVILYMTQVGKETKNTENGLIDTGYMVGVEITDPEEQKKVQTSVSYIVEDKKNNTTNPQIQYLPMSMLSNLKIVSKKRFRLLKSIMIDNFKLEFNSDVSSTITATNVEPVMPINPIEPGPVTAQTVQPIDQPIDPVANLVNPVAVQPVMPINSVEPVPEPVTDQTVQPIAQPIETVVPINSIINQSEVTETVTPSIPEIPSVPVNPIITEPTIPIENDISNNAQETQSTEVNTNSNVTTINDIEDNNIIIDYRTKYFEEEEKNKELQAQIDLLTQKLNEIKKVIE